MNRVCTKCSAEKPIENFYKDKNGRDGHRSSCKTCEIKRRSQYRKENINEERSYRRSIYASNKAREAREKILAKDPEYFSKANKKYYKKNKEKILKKRIEKDKNRRQNDELYKIRRATSNLISCSIKRNGFKKTSKTANIIGCSWDFFKSYLECRFVEGMNWNNYGEWHIDHIVPCSSAHDIDTLMSLNHYTNLQPLWAKDNLSKGSKIEDTFDR